MFYWILAGIIGWLVLLGSVSYMTTYSLLCASVGDPFPELSNRQLFRKRYLAPTIIACLGLISMIVAIVIIVLHIAIAG
jgi:hypothetical protein